ncbi:MAG: hypothetical protein II840_04240 [Kiritimatiellae bacterium]|nr:hypothetical protein [Kiritimatiellia bacterium]
MSGEARMTSGESPRPWSILPLLPDVHFEVIADDEGRFVGMAALPEDAALIVRAVNGREDLLKAREMLQAECRGLAAEADRMAEFVRRLCDMVADHPIWRPSEAEQWLIAEARKAIGEGKV